MKHSLLCGSLASLLLAVSSPSFAGGLQQGQAGNQIGNQGLNPGDFPICSFDAKVYPLDMAWGFENGMSCRFASLDQAEHAAHFPDCSSAAQVYDQDPHWGWENNQSCWRGGYNFSCNDQAQGKGQAQQGQAQQGQAQQGKVQQQGQVQQQGKAQGQQGQIQGQQQQSK